jgi:GNAT superfamily N-acetyltransferase
MTARYFTPAYVEHATLRDGTRVVLRLLTPGDKQILRAGFERLSPESRYLRFLVPKDRLTDDELRYLCEVDQEHHFALGAVREDGDDPPVGLGIARFIRMPDRPGEPVTAEAAVAVADEVHGQGLGKLLFMRLVAAATERGIQRFHCDVLCENSTIQTMIEELAPEYSVEVGGDVMSFEVPLPAIAPDAPATSQPGGPMYQLFRAAARRMLQVIALPLRSKP